MVVPASRKRKRPGAAEPPDGADMSRWHNVKTLCQKAIQHGLSDPEGVDAFSHAAREVVDAFGVNYDDCFGEVYTRHGAPAFFPRLKIIMEVCSICGLLQINSHSNAILQWKQKRPFDHIIQLSIQQISNALRNATTDVLSTQHQCYST